MAADKAYLEYILDSLSGLDELSHRAMMGEYIIYYRGKIAAYICDDRLLVKPVAAAEKLLPNAPRELPYEGAKPRQLLITREQWEQMQNGTYAPPAPPVEDALP